MKILFLCVANAARSQMAEALARRFLDGQHLVQSAGSKPTTVHPLAIRVLAEIGIDASMHRSKSVAAIDPASVDTVITLCATEECPVFLGQAKRLHWPLTDPARTAGTEEERIEAFRAVRDEIRGWLALLRF